MLNKQTMQEMSHADLVEWASWLQDQLGEVGRMASNVMSETDPFDRTWHDARGFEEQTLFALRLGHYRNDPVVLTPEDHIAMPEPEGIVIREITLDDLEGVLDNLSA